LRLRKGKAGPPIQARLREGRHGCRRVDDHERAPPRAVGDRFGQDVHVTVANRCFRDDEEIERTS
jgi:hypothetical protein